MKTQFEAWLNECPVIAILRGITQEEVGKVCDILLESGIRLLEIPLNSPNALESISVAARHCAGRQMTGAGTVLTPEDVVAVKEAGGKFIISPNTNPEVIRESRRLGLISIPGFFTVTEGFAAVQAGADYLKLFPAMLGAGYIKDMKAVIKAPVIAVGGVHAGNIPSFMEVCVGVGVGSALYKSGKSLEEIRRDAKKIVSSVISVHHDGEHVGNA